MAAFTTLASYGAVEEQHAGLKNLLVVEQKIDLISKDVQWL